MKSFSLCLLLLAGAACAQVLPIAPVLPEIPDETVLAVFDDGVKFTMRNFRALYTILPPQAQQAAMNNRVEWIRQYAFFRKLAAMAEKDKLDQMSPTKEALEYQRMVALSGVQLNASMNTLSVDGAEIVKAYESSKEDFKQVKVKVIYVSFVSEALLKSGAAKGLNETQAKAKAEKLVREIRGGADFVKLVKANSDDADSRDKDGDFTTMRRTDKLPEAIRTAVFALKRGEISDPVRQPNGFYIFKADDVIFSPLSEVRDEIYNQVKMKMHEKWVADTVANTKVDLVSNDFFKPSAPAAKPAAPPAK
jgi:hypothetical protein